MSEEEKKQGIDQKFCEEYTKKCLCIKRSTVSQYHAHCTVCCFDVKFPAFVAAT